MLCLDMSKTFLLCVALAIVPPIVIVALHYDQWFAARPIDPRLASGEVLFFEANWCGACRSMQPVVAQLRGEGFDIRTLDVDTHQKQAIDYDIHSIPAFVLLRDGQEVRRSVGVISPDSLRQLWR
jgi:thioredoxin 1